MEHPDAVLAFKWANAIQVTATQRPLEGVRLTLPPYQPVGGGVQAGIHTCDYTTLGFLQQRAQGISLPWLSPG